MKARSLVTRVIALAMALFAASCKREHSDKQVVWIGDADLPDYSEVVADFSNAFASDALCRGIRIEEHEFPDEPYWFLEHILRIVRAQDA